MRVSYRLIDANDGEVRLPDSGEVIAPRYPGGEVTSDEDRQSRRVQLALWMTSRENDFFARATANWAWTHMFGRGLVDSLDVHTTADESQLLDELADYFVNSGYDLRELLRALAITRVYQLSSFDTQLSSTAPVHFSRMLVKPLTPEQLYDSFTILAPATNTDQPDVTEPNNGPRPLDDNPLRMEFVRRMRPPPGSAVEYHAGTLQALMLMNGRTMAHVTAAGESNLLGALDAPFMNDDDRVESLFLATLSRRPDSDEAAACLETLCACHSTDERNRALSDVLWALLNTTEFAFNH